MYTVEIFNDNNVSIFGKPSRPMEFRDVSEYIQIHILNDLTDGFYYRIKEV